MLAAPRRKQKFSIDPRGSSWSKDENKFGQKMLEKMGWSRGHGLGANEDGRVEHVKISHKDDTRGVGCSKSQSDNWIAHQTDFDSLLANLNQVYVNKDESKEKKTEVMQNLEKKSKSAKSRIHYQKFIQSKDLSSRKMEDLDCIFGRRKSKQDKEKKTEDVIVSEKMTSEKTESKEESFGVQTFESSDNLQTYFAKKMSKLESPKASGKEEDDVDNNPASIGEVNESFGSQTTSSQSYQSYFAIKMAKLNKQKANGLSEPEIMDDIPNETEKSVVVKDELMDSIDIIEAAATKRKSKKRKNGERKIKKSVEDLAENLLSNKSLQDSISKKTVRFSEPICSVFVIRPDDLSDSCKDLVKDEVTTETLLGDEHLSSNDTCLENEKLSKKKSKKRKKQKLNENKTVVNCVQNSLTTTAEVKAPSKKKKKSKRKDKSKELDCDSSESNSDNFENVTEFDDQSQGQKVEETMETSLSTNKTLETETPDERKEKKSKKRKIEEVTVDVENETHEESNAPKKSKKKKRHSKQNFLIHEDEKPEKSGDKNFPDADDENDTAGEIQEINKSENVVEETKAITTLQSIEKFIELKRQEEIERLAVINAKRNIELSQRFVGSNIDKIPGYSKNQTYLHV